MADNASVTLSATILPEEIAKTISGAMTVAPDDANDKWYFKITNVPHNTGTAKLIAGSFVSEETIGTVHDTVATGDKVKFLFVKHTGTTDGTTATTESLLIGLRSADTAVHTLSPSIVLRAGESWYGRLPNVTVNDLTAISTNTAVSGVGSGTVQCLVGALLDDV